MAKLNLDLTLLPNYRVKTFYTKLFPPPLGEEAFNLTSMAHTVG